MSDLLKKLFVWKKTIQLTEDVVVYMRVVSDRVIEEARTKGLIEANRLRRNLRDPNTEDFLQYMEAAEYLTKDQLIDQIVGMAAIPVIREFRSKTPLPELRELSEYPTQEEMEEYEVSKIERETRYLESLKIYLETWQKDFSKPLHKMEESGLIPIWRKYRIDVVAEEKMSNVYDEHVLRNAVYADDTYSVLAFTDEEYKEIPTDIRDKLFQEYRNLRMGAEELKK